MGFSVTQVFLIALSYLLLLFAVAWITDRGWIPPRLVRHPAVYVLSLGVYASAWAMYGTLGYAWDHGYNFLAYFLGISGVFMLGPILLSPILRLTITHQLGSLADLFAFRYRSRLVGALTTGLMILGMLPLLSAQFRAVVDSVEILTGASPRGLVLWFGLLIMLFAILFGARHATAREKHEGLVMAIATESLIKVAAIVTVTLIGLFVSFDGPGGLNAWLAAHPEAVNRLYKPLQEGTWHSLIMAFFVSAVVMPHMFYMAFTENLNPRALMTASWGFPLLLLLIALCIPIILWSAMAHDMQGAPEFFVLSVGQLGGGHGALIAYVAGLAGASGTLIVATLALSSMALNNLVLPARHRRLDARLYRWLLWARRILIVALLSSVLLFHSLVGEHYRITELAVLSFVATLQFVPGLIGVLFWPGATRRGLLWGLAGGFVCWAGLLVIPTLFPDWEPAALFRFLHIDRSSPLSQWHQITLTTIFVNGALFFFMSRFSRPGIAEQSAADACVVGSLRRPFRWELGSRSVDEFITALAAPLGPATARREVRLALRDLNLTETETRPYALRRLRDQIETNLSGLLGPAVAHQMVDDYLPYKARKDRPGDQDIQFIEARLEQYRDRLSGLAAELDSLRRFHRQTLLELPMGVVSLGADDEIIGWNRAMEHLTGIDGQRIIGSRLNDLDTVWGQLLSRFVQGEARRDHSAELQVEGQTRIISLHKSQIQPESPVDRGAGWVVVVEDVTELQAMEARLAHNERLASIGRLAAGVAHEIGNPVTAIACLAQNIEHEPQLEDIREDARQILTQTRRISRIVESLVTFSHTGTAPGAPFTPVDVHATVSEAFALLQFDPERRQHQFHNLCAQVYVQGDAQRLLQVFVNLLSNAADASPRDSVISVATRDGDNGIEVLVEDEGAGIPADLQRTLFEPFVTSKPAGQGTGLGLALVYSIIEDHFGSIRVESPIAAGRGTRFVITLPRAADGADNAEDTA